ncbi:TIGR02556 family CRISPR-associated protein [Coprothermobacter platensis]|uniref:TIGR02556 family CRISPR-associated protein n=1 Tax=Coprothermobacter platensis TaxID=108819 RepID=UPI00035C9452|nr:TIGR02556 family CRISPR-associated protein [Coprothermobacter platensis]
MIESIAMLGHLENQQYGDDKIRKMVQSCYNHKVKGKQKLIEINFNITGNDVLYNKVILVDLRPEHGEKLLYNGGFGNSSNPSPSAFQTDNDTFGLKILGYFTKTLELKNLSEEEKHFLNKVYEELLKNENKIRSEIQNNLQQKEKGDNFFITLTFNDGETTLFPRDIPLFVKIFETLLLNLDKEPNKENETLTGTCSICGKSDVKLAFPSTKKTYKFFNKDKSGPFYDLDENNIYNAFPVCEECLNDIERGKEYIKENLEFTFVQGLKYHLIPQFFVSDEAVEEFLKIVNSSDKEEVRELQQHVRKEEMVLYKLGTLSDTIAVNFLFLEIKNAAEKIVMFIQDVYPSRLRTIYEAKDAVDSIYREMFPTIHDFSFLFVRDFFPRKGKYQSGSEKTKGLNNYFLNVTRCIFEGRPLDNAFVFRFVMNKIIEEFHSMQAGEKNAYFIPTVKEAEMLIMFLQKLNLLRGKETTRMNKDELFDDYFEKFADLYGSPLKRGLFLLGAAVNIFTMVQLGENRYGNAPFLDELKGLKMNYSDFKGLTSKLQSKLFEYGKAVEEKNKWMLRRANRILGKATEYLLQVTEPDVTVQEMNFYFVAGFHQGYDISSHVGSKLKSLSQSDETIEDKEDKENE